MLTGRFFFERMLTGRLSKQNMSCINAMPFSHSQLLSAVFFYSQRVDYNIGAENKTDEIMGEDDASYTDVPRPSPKWQRKPYPTPMKILIRRAKEEKKARQENPCRILEHAPENGLLVPHLVEVAHRVYNAWESLNYGLSKLVESDLGIHVNRCRFCSELHIGHVGHEIRTCEGPKCGARRSTHVWRRGRIKDIIGLPYCYHLYDRVGKPRVVHKEKFKVQRLPAVVELCIQAGLELEGYPTKRRSRPVYSIDGRIADFEQDENEDVLTGKPLDSAAQFIPLSIRNNSQEEGVTMTMSEMGAKTLESWFEMRSGAIKLMEKYSVITCGYCPEVQVGPKGHKVRMCKATKHQQRDGMHAWQEATIDDLIRPNYVWHVKDLQGPPLVNELKRYYGKAPAIVELCVQAGVPVPEQFRSIMRLDVVPPDRDEYDLVA